MGLGFPVRIKYDVVRRRYLPRLAAVEEWTLSPKLFAGDDHGGTCSCSGCHSSSTQPQPSSHSTAAAKHPLTLPPPPTTQVCDCPPGDYKLGVSRLFLRHRAAQVLESLDPLESAVLDTLVRTKVASFWEAASRIRNRLLAYHHRRKFRSAAPRPHHSPPFTIHHSPSTPTLPPLPPHREFFRGVLVAQKYLRMWLSQTRYRRKLMMALRIQNAYRTHVIRVDYRHTQDAEGRRVPCTGALPAADRVTRVPAAAECGGEVTARISEEASAEAVRRSQLTNYGK